MYAWRRGVPPPPVAQGRLGKARMLLGRVRAVFKIHAAILNKS